MAKTSFNSFYVIVFYQIVIAVPQLSEPRKIDDDPGDEIDAKDLPSIFRCGFNVVDDQLRDKAELFEIWIEYRPFLEFLTNKVEGCMIKHGESQAER